MTRAIVGVLDSLGVGAALDAAKFGDAGANTLGHIAHACCAGEADRDGVRTGALHIPNLAALGLVRAAEAACGQALPVRCTADEPAVFYERRESTTAFALDLLKRRGYTVDVSAQDLARQKDLHIQGTEGRIGHNEYWSEFLQMRGVVDAAQRKILIQQISEQTHEVVAIPGGSTAMAGLKQRVFVLGIVTDTMYPVEWKMRWLKKVGVAEFIGVIACSTVLGAHKPNPKLYVNAMQQAGLAPSASAFVGHDARELGTSTHSSS